MTGRRVQLCSPYGKLRKVPDVGGDGRTRVSVPNGAVGRVVSDNGAAQSVLVDFMGIGTFRVPLHWLEDWP